MSQQKILITGGAGFVGSQLAERFSRDGAQVIILDNLKRRGSELNLSRLTAMGITFIHGDVRIPSDFETLPKVDILIDCSAEPSVHAGSNGSPDYVIHTNLGGTYHMLEWARKQDSAFILLSTSRVYPIKTLNDLPCIENEYRYDWTDSDITGASAIGIQENFSIDGPRSLYGTSKLCSEMLLQEYIHLYGMKGIINRCGILAGPYQMGKVDQGVIALWVARHVYEGKLNYHGFGGHGKQVRDLLHVDDLYQLLVTQIQTQELWQGDIYNIGGGKEHSVSLLELTNMCEEVTKHSISIGSVPETSPLDLKVYLTDSTKAMEQFKWRPKLTPRDIVLDIYEWISDHKEELRYLF